jgi:hypothetical protein
LLIGDQNVSSVLLLAAMQLGIFENLDVLKGDDTLIIYEAVPGSGTVRKSCSKCGSFAYKILGNGAKVAPLGALSGDVVMPTCHIFVKDKGNQEIMFPDLPQYDTLPQ